ncbi:antibiotic biosynthesis monooxygenase [Sphingomonas bacterium]|uniref:antibiotic biosynthesis monooxygenase n=1 Tax=Sphingomonas bacterium TaxID=1895847 RepID=UPI0015766C4A|nr:antibiotic biosynthesis monooxygenase [Sphingomonas bacterium]
MAGDRQGWVAVIFAARRNGLDEAGYAAAARAMDALAAAQPGYRGVESARGADGFGITVSYWADDAAAIAWRDHPDHAATREAGRARWYDAYSVTVAQVERGYRWSR